MTIWEFMYSRTKGNNTGAGKNSDMETAYAMREAVIQQMRKAGTKGFMFTFCVEGRVYGLTTTLECMLQRVKLEPNGQNLTIVMPATKAQVIEFIPKATFIGTIEDLEAVRKSHKEVKNNGQAVEYVLAKKRHRKFDHTKQWYMGGEFCDYEVKFFDYRGASAPHCRMTTRKQLESLGYRF